MFPGQSFLPDDDVTLGHHDNLDGLNLKLLSGSRNQAFARLG